MEHFVLHLGGTWGGGDWGGKLHQRTDLHTYRIKIYFLMVLERVMGMLIDSTSSLVSAMASQKSKVDAEPATTRDANPDRTIILERNWTVYKK